MFSTPPAFPAAFSSFCAHTQACALMWMGWTTLCPHRSGSSTHTYHFPVDSVRLYPYKIFSSKPLFSLSLSVLGKKHDTLSASSVEHGLACMMPLSYAARPRILVLRPHFLLGSYALISLACLTCFLCLECALTHCPVFCHHQTRALRPTFPRVFSTVLAPSLYFYM